MGNSRNTGFINNIIKYDANGNVNIVSGSTTLLYISSSGAITTTGVISGSNALSASYALTASFVTLAQTASFVTTAQTASFVTTAQTASFVTTAQTASFVANAQSASNAVTAQTASFANTFTVASTLTAQTLVVQTITSSVDFVTGSTRFGSLLANTHVFTGSMAVTGGLVVTTTTPELTVGATGVTLGNIITDTHNVTGSLRVSGSANFIGNADISNGSISNDSGDRSLTIYGSLGSANNDVATLQLIQMWNGRAYRSIVSAQQDTAGGPASSALVFKTSFFNGTDVTTSERMRITTGGIVGIGTAIPKSYSTLTVNGQTIGLNNIGIDAGQSFRLNNYYNSGTTTDRTISTGYAASIGLNNSVGAMTFNTSNTSASADNNITVTERMRITSDGNVGIGTSNPASKLHMFGSGANTQTLNLQSSANNANAYAVFSSGNKGYITGLSGDISNSYIIYDNNAAVTRLAIASGGDATFSGNLAINNTLSSPGNLIETAGLNVYLRPASGYRVFIDTGDGLNVSSGVTNLSNLRISTIYTEYSKNLSGTYNSGTFYEIVNSSQMASGIYILRAYVDTYAAGGGTYFVTYASVPFYFYTSGTNNTGAVTFPSMIGSGHANMNPPIIRIRLSSNASGGLTYLEFDPNATWTNLNGTGGATVTFYVKRLGD